MANKRIIDLALQGAPLTGLMMEVADATTGISKKTAFVDASVKVASVTAGAGITIGGTATAPIVTNNGVRSISAGSGMTVDNTNPNIPIVTNNGVRSATADVGVVIGGTANAPTFGLKYRSYVCIVKVATGAITQTVVLQNEIGDGGAGGATDIAWTVVGVNGLRAGMSTGTPFTTDKVFIVCPSVEGVAVPDPFFVVPKIVDQNNIDLIVYRRDASQSLSDGSYFVEIRVYP